MTETTLPDWLPDLDGTIVAGDLLRAWSLSAVWRIHFDGATHPSVIVKRSLDDAGGEARRYRDLVGPLGVRAPRLLAEGGPGVIVLEDLGGDTLENQPTGDGYEQAVRTLVAIRTESARRLADDPALAAAWSVDLPAVAVRADAAVTALRPDLAGALDDPIRALTVRLRRLSGDGEPATLVHGDYVAKNLLHTRGGVVALDWQDAYVHAHLGDLYQLLRDGRKQGHIDAVRENALSSLYARLTGTDAPTVADWLVTGGLCWTFVALRWIAETGVHTEPLMRDWIDELVTDLRELAA